MAGYAAEDSQMESDWDGRQLLEYGNAVEDEVDCTVKVADGFSESQRQGGWHGCGSEQYYSTSERV